MKARKWFCEQEKARSSQSLVFVIDTLGVLLSSRNWDASFTDELHRLLVHKNHRTGGIVGCFVSFQHVCQARDKVGVGFERPFKRGRA